MKDLIAEDQAAPRRSLGGGLDGLENRVAYVDGCGNRCDEAGSDSVE